MGEAGPRFEPVVPVKKLESLENEKFEEKRKQFMEAAEKARELFVQEREMRAAYRRQSRPLWQNEAEQLPQAQREQLTAVIEAIINKEENTEVEVAAEEAQKMHEDIQELIVEKKCKTYTDACAMVVERREYQLKSEKRIEQEETIRPYVLFIEKSIEQDKPQAAREMIKILPPNRKADFGVVPEIFDRVFDKKTREYERAGDVVKLADLQATQFEIVDIFDIKNLEKMDAEMRQSPVFIKAAKKFLQNKLEEVTNFFCAGEIKEYIWMQTALIKAGTIKAGEIAKDQAMQWQLTTILIGHSAEDKNIFLDHVERYNYLKNQLEEAGILDKSANEQDPRVQETLFALMDNSLEKKKNLSDKEIFERYLQICSRMTEYGLLEKEKIAGDQKIQEKLKELLVRQLTAQASGKERLNNVLGFYQTVLAQELLPAEEVKKFKQDPAVIKKIQNALTAAIAESPAEEKQSRYIDFRQHIGALDLATYEAIDRWNVVEKGETAKAA